VYVQYFLENLWQGVLTQLRAAHGLRRGGLRIVVGGDGRLFNDFAIERYACMDGCMDGCMYVCMYMNILMNIDNYVYLYAKM
jgi:hypothetical protein